MSRRRSRARRAARRERQEQAPSREERAREGTPIRTQDRTYCFRARGGVTFSFPISSPVLQGNGDAQTPSDVAALLFDHAMRGRGESEDDA